jgi:hypothetical protein
MQNALFYHDNCLFSYLCLFNIDLSQDTCKWTNYRKLVFFCRCITNTRTSRNFKRSYTKYYYLKFSSQHLKGELKSAVVIRQVGREQHSAAVYTWKHDSLRRKREGEFYCKARRTFVHEINCRGSDYFAVSLQVKFGVRRVRCFLATLRDTIIVSASAAPKRNNGMKKKLITKSNVN